MSAGPFSSVINFGSTRRFDDSLVEIHQINPGFTLVIDGVQDNPFAAHYHATAPIPDGGTGLVEFLSACAILGYARSRLSARYAR